MNKDFNQLHIDFLYETDTDEHNGVEVKVPFKGQIDADAWRTLAFIKNIYLNNTRSDVYSNDNSFVKKFNNRNIITYKTFKMLQAEHPVIEYNYLRSTSILVGDIPYPVKYELIWKESDISDKREWKDIFRWIIPMVKIGEVDVTPNREELLYSEKTKKALRDAYNASIKEIEELWNAQTETPVDSFTQFAELLLGYKWRVLHLKGDINLDMPDSLPIKIKYKDFEKLDLVTIRDALNLCFHRNISYYVICKYNTNRNEMQSSRSLSSTDIRDIILPRSPLKIIAVPSSAGFSSKYLKGFLSSKYAESVLIVKQHRVTHGELRRIMADTFGITSLAGPYYRSLVFRLIKEIFLWFRQNIEVLDIMHSPEYLKYKKDNKEEVTYTRDKSKITFNTYYPNSSTPIRETLTVGDMLAYLHRKYKDYMVVYAPIDSPLINGFVKVQYPRLVILGLSQSNVLKASKGLFPSWIKPIQELYTSDNRVLRKMATLNYIKTQLNGMTLELHSAFPKSIRMISIQLRDYYKQYQACSYCNFDLGSFLSIIPESKYDIEILSLYHQIKPYVEKYDKIKNTERNAYYYLTWYVLMKERKIRLDYDFYKTLKEVVNNIKQIL